MAFGAALLLLCGTANPAQTASGAASPTPDPLLILSSASGLGAATNSPPRVFLMDGERLLHVRNHIQSPEITPAINRLKEEAERALDARYVSVAYKAVTPPSGDKHDYLSQGPYWWSNPDTSNGLPYIRKDGERNPEINLLPDKANMNRMAESVETLSLAYYLFGEEKYARKAARLLRVWFLDKATRMNPNFNFAQGIPGVTAGRGIGLIESRVLIGVVDSAGLLEGSPAWAEADHQKLRQWFGEFLKWMIESKHGKDEAAARNNHGTYYDLQVAAFALFTGRPELAVNVLNEARAKRIAAQIAPDGSQPLEIARTKSWSYSVMNLNGLIELAELGRKTGIDLWGFETEDGRGIRKAVEYLRPYALGEAKWPHREIGKFSPEALHPALRRASVRYLGFQEVANALPPLADDSRKRLTASLPE